MGHHKIERNAPNPHLRGKKTRKLGKWKTGYGGALAGKYVARRRAARKQSRRSRARNAR